MYKVTIKQGYSTITVTFKEYSDANLFIKIILDNDKDCAISIENAKEGEE